MTSSLSTKQHELIRTFEGLLNRYQFGVYIDRVTAPLSDICSIDVEHDEDGNMVGIGLYDGKAAHYYTSDIETLKIWLPHLKLIAHNGITDFECLRQWGIPIRDEQLVWDTYLMAHIQDSSLKAYGLKDMAKRELGIEYPSYDDIVGKRTAKQKAERVTLDKQPIELVAAYNAMDTYTTFKLYEKQKQCLV